MKMIASTKLARAQKAMEVGRVFGASTNTFYQYVKPEERTENETAPTLIIACSSDRGLCGAIHSSISKLARRTVAEAPGSHVVIVLGDKAKAQIARYARKAIIMHFNQIGRTIPTFLDAANIVDTIASQKILQEMAYAKIMYNAFRSVIAYDTTVIKAFTEGKLAKTEALAGYEIDDDTLGNFVDFLLASQLFWALVEGHASEMAAKRTAMDNATKNAGAIIIALTMKYNRTRQSVITNELVDIITGASAL